MQAYTREEAMQFLIERLDGKWPTDISDAPLCPGWGWHADPTVGWKVSPVFMPHVHTNYITYSEYVPAFLRYKRNTATGQQPAPIYTVEPTTTIETLIKSWSELRDEANRLREQLTAAEQAERDAHAQVEAALAAAGWGGDTSDDDKQDPSTWKVGDEFEVIDNRTGSATLTIGDRLVMIEDDGTDIRRYRHIDDVAADEWWWVCDTDLRKL